MSKINMITGRKPYKWDVHRKQKKQEAHYGLEKAIEELECFCLQIKTKMLEKSPRRGTN